MAAKTNSVLDAVKATLRIEPRLDSCAFRERIFVFHVRTIRAENLFLVIVSRGVSPGQFLIVKCRLPFQGIAATVLHCGWRRLAIFIWQSIEHVPRASLSRPTVPQPLRMVTTH